MLLPLKYGAPGGMVLLLLFWLQIHFELNDLTLWRWCAGLTLLLGVSGWEIKRRSALAEFRVLWFSGFSTLMAAVMVFCILSFALRNELFSSIEHLEEVGAVSIIFYEFLSQSVIGLVLLTILSFVLKENTGGASPKS